LTNVVDHPRKRQRIAEAKNSLMGSIHRAGLGADLGKLNREEWAELCARALAFELEAPKTGLSIIRSALHRNGAMHGPEAA
jgi:hypothetical protein